MSYLNIKLRSSLTSSFPSRLFKWTEASLNSPWFKFDTESQKFLVVRALPMNLLASASWEFFDVEIVELYDRYHLGYSALIFHILWLEPSLRFKELRESRNHYCLPNEAGQFSLDTFIDRWYSQNHVRLRIGNGNFFKFKSAFHEMLRIKQAEEMLARFDGPVSEQVLLSVLVFILASSIAGDGNLSSDTAPNIGKKCCMSSQSYRQKITGRSIFDGVISRTSLNGELLVENKQVFFVSEGSTDHEDRFRRQAQKSRYTSKVPRHQPQRRRTNRSSASHRAGYGSAVYRRHVVDRPISQQKLVGTAVADHTKLQVESLSSCSLRV